MQTQPQITVHNRKTGDKKIYRLDQDRASIGREPSNYIVLDDRTVSRKHAEILQENNQYFVRDLKSNNGTHLNDKPLSPQEKALLRTGDVVLINDFEIVFSPARTSESAAGGEDIYEITDTDLLEVKMVKKLLQAMDKENAPSLEVIEGPQTGLRFVLEGKSQDVVIGRDPACEFVIDSTVISRKHARIEKRYDSVILHDLRSKNGTFINREKIESKRLQDGDIVHLGTLAVSFRNPQELNFDFGPPEISLIKKPQAEAPISEDSEEAAPEAGASGARGSRRQGGSRPEAPLPPAEIPQDHYPAESHRSPVAPETSGVRLSLSPGEIAAIGVGLIVLIGSIWGIFKLL